MSSFFPLILRIIDEQRLRRRLPFHPERVLQRGIRPFVLAKVAWICIDLGGFAVCRSGFGSVTTLCWSLWSWSVDGKRVLLRSVAGKRSDALRIVIRSSRRYLLSDLRGSHLSSVSLHRYLGIGSHGILLFLVRSEEKFRLPKMKERKSIAIRKPGLRAAPGVVLLFSSVRLDSLWWLPQ